MCAQITERYGTQLLLRRRRWLGLYLDLENLDHLDHLALHMDSLKPPHQLTNNLQQNMDHLDLIDLHMDNLRPLHQLTNNLHHNLENLDHLAHLDHLALHMDNLKPPHQHMNNLHHNLDNMDHTAGLSCGGTGWWGITNLVRYSILTAFDILCLC